MPVLAVAVALAELAGMLVINQLVEVMVVLVFKHHHHLEIHSHP